MLRLFRETRTDHVECLCCVNPKFLHELPLCTIALEAWARRHGTQS